MNNDALLTIQSLRTCFQTPAGIARAVDGVSLNVHEGQVLGIVGESGCGKSVLSLSILRLLPMPPAFFDGGAIVFRGRNLLDLSLEELRSIRGNEISMIFQEPMTALNPVFTVGDQLAEVYRVHRGLSRKEAWRRAIGMLERVGVPAPESRVREYPFQLSGGMRQRVMIAMALACRPKLLIADEPTTALDVTIQAQILDLMEKLKEEMGTAIILISHDLGVIAEMAQEVAVMYTGRVVERADTLELFDHPLHPYTRGLMQAIPSPDMSMADGELYEIPGVVPSLTDLPRGCSFHPRCAIAGEICRSRAPDLMEVRPGHWAACWMIDGGAHA
ncbi:oligopeptide transport system ATP-binding protein [Desulfacinum infernum DSM 9756]|uniref:Oligopeptide transport system ATP-binding protein n=1 Tax=Desulfacinum infernum DSM 9756 TaxID=1121391 RepID=A0A1M4XW76_9BACT|nr:oligopeptide transport system ATP-binding protein [Desulfacinum infernum DSM 9756]